MIIEYAFVAETSGMNMNAIVHNVIFCSYEGDTIYYIYLNNNGEPSFLVEAETE